MSTTKVILIPQSLYRNGGCEYSEIAAAINSGDNPLILAEFRATMI